MMILSKASIAQLPSPTNVTVTPQGTTGTTSYSYRVSAENVRGETLASDAVTITTGNINLDAENFNRISWDAVSGATNYNIYGRKSGTEYFIGSTTETQFDDIGNITPSYAPPIINTTHVIFSLLQDNIGSNVMATSENERILLQEGDSIEIFTDTDKVNIILFGDLIALS